MSKEMQQKIDEMLAQKNWAVIGASPDPSRYGNKIIKKLKNGGYNIFPINPKYDEIEGLKSYAKLADIAEEVDCISMVVNKEIATKAVEEAAEKKVKYIWFQPNTYNAEIVQKAEDKGILTVYDTCILLH